MPGSTPRYGFPYPCPGEAVGPAAFSALANAIANKMNDTNADYQLMLNRRNIDTSGGTQVVAPGGDVVLTPASSTYTFPVAGVYAITGGVDIVGFATTLNMERIRILQNGVSRTGSTMNPGNDLGVPVRAYGIMVAAAADVLTMIYRWDGTGSMTVAPMLSVKMLCRIA